MKLQIFATLLLLFSLFHGNYSFRFYRDPRQKKTCEKVKSSICSHHVHEGYNSTKFPNLLNHNNQEQAIQELQQWAPLIKIGCSKHLPTFLCAIYVPLCVETLDSVVIPPCQSLCELARSGCQPVMQKFGFDWKFDCSKFPLSTKEKMCVNAVKEKKKKKDNNGKKTKKGWHIGNDEKPLNFKCTSGKVMFIRKIRHSLNSKCCPLATKAVLSAMCNGKEMCNIKVSKESLGGHCSNKVGTLKVKYKCVPKVDNIVEPCEKRTA